MSDKNKNKKTMPEDFLRYRRNEMTSEEKNSFERELQKDAFAEEAAEGMALISPDEVSKDITNLHNRLRKRIKPIQRFIVYRIAASIAVLIVISSIFIIVERNNPTKHPSETPVQAELLEITEGQSIKEPPAKKEPKEKTVMVQKKRADEPVSLEVIMEPAKSDLPVEQYAVADAQIIDSGNDKKLMTMRKNAVIDQITAVPAAKIRDKSPSALSAKGKILSSDDNMPLPGATIMVKGTSTGVMTDKEGNFAIALPDTANRTLIASYIGMNTKEFSAKTDSEIKVSLDPSQLALDEVVVVGYGVNKKEDQPIEYIPPQPVGGKADFEKYIRENLQYPDTTITDRRVVVVVGFLVRNNGDIDKIRILKSPGKQFSDEAIRLIKSGPRWKPAEENGTAKEDEVRVRIVFKDSNR